MSPPHAQSLGRAMEHPDLRGSLPPTWIWSRHPLHSPNPRLLRLQPRTLLAG